MQQVSVLDGKFDLNFLTELELYTIDGGDAAPYGKGADIGLAVQRICDAAHATGDFIWGMWDGLTGRQINHFFSYKSSIK